MKTKHRKFSFKSKLPKLTHFRRKKPKSESNKSSSNFWVNLSLRIFMRWYKKFFRRQEVLIMAICSRLMASVELHQANAQSASLNRRTLSCRVGYWRTSRWCSESRQHSSVCPVRSIDLSFKRRATMTIASATTTSASGIKFCASHTLIECTTTVSCFRMWCWIQELALRSSPFCSWFPTFWKV